MFTPEERAMLDRYPGKLLSEAHALSLALQEECPQLGSDDLSEDGMVDLWRWYKAQYDAMLRHSRRWNWWAAVHVFIEDAQKLLEQTESDLVN